MDNILLIAILVILILIFLQGNRFGEWIGQKLNRMVYNWRTRKRWRRHE